MHSVKCDLKLFLYNASAVDLEAFIPIFHHWIQAQALEELLIDVADYRHVHHGPGVMLIAHDAHYAMDMAEGRLGLLYSRRRETHPSRQALQGVGERLASLLQCALAACQRLEAEPVLAGRCRFRGDEWLLRFNDQLHAPNTVTAYHDLKYALEPVLATLYPGQQVAVDHVGEGSSRLTVVVKAAENPDVATLLRRLAPPEQPVNGIGTAL